MKLPINRKLLVLLFLTVIVFGPAAIAQENQNTRHPNILLIFIDDMGWPAVSALGNEHVQTVNIDRIANEGMLFTDAYVNPQCTPSRASLLTGQHTARTRFWHVVGRYGYPYMRMDEPPYNENLSREAYTMAEMLQDNGYRTAINGKWHLHTWNSRYPDPDGYYTYLFDHANAYYGWDYNTIPDNMHYHQQTDKGVDFLTDEAIQFIDRNSDSPFFVYLSHQTIHGPVLAPEKLIKKYLNKGYPEEGVFNATYLAAIEHLDNSVGRLLDHLDKTGLTDNTMVIFLTDNGGVDAEFSNEPLRYGKGSMYEGGIRVPMMVRWPGITGPGTVCKTPVHAIDIYPSLLEIAGGTMKQQWTLDGISILPLLQQEGGFTRETLYWYMPLYDAGWGATPCAVIRKGDYKLIEFFGDYCDRENDWKMVPGRRTELFNLANDLGEKEDLSGKMPEKTRELRNELYQWIHDMDAPLPTLNERYDPDRAWERTRLPLNFRPILENELPDITFRAGENFSFIIDPHTFKEYDDEELSYFVCAEGGEALPDWINFNPDVPRFTGKSEDPISLIIEVKAVDPQGAAASDKFEVIIK
ncbi:MAG: sulfatase-like hydrolase/transferase [Bacteroidales bacterium]|nr:sulfatase-like hydrolase/transferase [Bacteroidales bacterium]